MTPLLEHKFAQDIQPSNPLKNYDGPQKEMAQSEEDGEQPP